MSLNSLLGAPKKMKLLGRMGRRLLFYGDEFGFVQVDLDIVQIVMSLGSWGFRPELPKKAEWTQRSEPLA